MAVTPLASHTEPERKDSRTLAEAFDHMLNESDSSYFIKGAFYPAREAIRRAKAAAEAVPALRKKAIDMEGDARLEALKEDPRGRKKFAFNTGVALAAILALFDVIPANISSQALGFDSNLTNAVTALFTILLAAVMFALGVARPGPQRRLTIAFVIAILAFIGALRWNFTATMTADPAAALIEAAGLTMATLIIIVAGVVVLALTKSAKVSDAEASASKAREVADAKRSEAHEIEEHAKTEESAFISLTLANSAGYFVNDEQRREDFIEYVRNELYRV